MLVKAAPGTKCPKEGNPKQYITDSVAIEVPQTIYYRRRIADNSLIPVPAPAGAGTKAGGK